MSANANAATVRPTPETLSPFREILRRCPQQRFATILDVGANVGQSTLAFAAAFPGSRIFAFEPAEASFRALSEATAGLGHVTAVQGAFSAEPGTLRMIMHGTTTRNRITEAPLSAHVKEVAVHRLDAWCAARGIAHVDFLKVDTEGHDLDVLRGATGLLPEVDFVQVEVSMNRYNRFHVPFAEVFDFLSDQGFHLFYVHGQAFEGRGYPVLRRADPIFVNGRVVGPMTGVITER
jgi:FkbM family methyltransferase